MAFWDNARQWGVHDRFFAFRLARLALAGHRQPAAGAAGRAVPGRPATGGGIGTRARSACARRLPAAHRASRRRHPRKHGLGAAGRCERARGLSAAGRTAAGHNLGTRVPARRGPCPAHQRSWRLRRVCALAAQCLQRPLQECRPGAQFRPLGAGPHDFCPRHRRAPAAPESAGDWRHSWRRNVVGLDGAALDWAGRRQRSGRALAVYSGAQPRRPVPPAGAAGKRAWH